MLNDVCGSLSKIWKITHAISFLNTRIFNPVNIFSITSELPKLDSGDTGKGLIKWCKNN